MAIQPALPRTPVDNLSTKERSELRCVPVFPHRTVVPNTPASFVRMSVGVENNTPENYSDGSANDTVMNGQNESHTGWRPDHIE